MCRDGAEGTATEASAMKTYAVANHFVGRNALACILGMGHACVGKVERVVQLFRSHRRIGWGDYDVLFANLLDECLGVQLIAFLLDVPEVLGLFLWVGKTFFVRIKSVRRAKGQGAGGDRYCLWNLFFTQ